MKPAGSEPALAGARAVPFNAENPQGNAPPKHLSRNRSRHRAFSCGHGRDINLSPAMRGSTQMVNKDQVKGVTKEVSGTVKEAAGKVTGSKKTEAKGKVEKAAGKVQKAYGDAKEGLKNAIRR
jgi:uncharacterized protein YjbJ (UPF0337 family)